MVTDFLEKEHNRQKENYVKTSSLSKKEKRIAVKERVQRSRDRKKALVEQIQNGISYALHQPKLILTGQCHHHRCSYQFHSQKDEKLLENENDEAMTTDCIKR